jgi:hypothetical protein
MIPRVARSGQSFDGAGQYYLHDKDQQRLSTDAERLGDYALHDKDNRQTSFRVGFTAILNMEAETPEQAISQMGASYERYKEREKNKRGRKLTKPVYAYSLAWAPDQTPTREEMMSAAHSSLKALKLEGLQTLIVQHTDEPQPHVHVIVNRIEPHGRSARNIYRDHLTLSRWAEQYERDHGGIRCEQRVANNERRDQGIFVKDTKSLTPAEYKARERAQKAASEKWRAEQAGFLKQAHHQQREGLWARQAGERNALEATTKARIESDRVAAKAKFQPQWRALYQQQAIQKRIVASANRGGIFDRACFVFSNREFLSKAGPLRLRDLARLCLSSKALTKLVDRVHTGERVALSNWERKLSDGAVGIAWREHLEAISIMRSRQQLEREGLRYTQGAEQQNAQAAMERAAEPQTPEPAAPAPSPAPELIVGENYSVNEVRSLLRDTERPTQSFNEVSRRAARRREETDEQFRARMLEYKRRHRGRDFGRDR